MHERHNFPGEAVRYVLQVRDKVSKCSESSSDRREVLQLRFECELY